MCVFHQQSYINLLQLLLTSISKQGNINKDTTEILVITHPTFLLHIQQKVEKCNLSIHYYLLDLHTLFEAGCARLHIFKYENIHKYDTILYLDTDILINSDINVMLNLELSPQKIYALEEGTIGGPHNFWGSIFFDFSKHDRNTTAFISGILLFKNSECMKLLFDSIRSHIEDYIYIKKNAIPYCIDQPFIVYNAISQNKYDNQVLKKYVENNPSIISSEKIVYHFPGGPGAYHSKYDKMTAFWAKIIEYGK